MGRTSFRQRFNFPPAHRFEGGKSATYRHEDLAVALTERAVAWIEKRDDEPFFLYFAQRNVHSPLRTASALPRQEPDRRLR